MDLYKARLRFSFMDGSQMDASIGEVIFRKRNYYVAIGMDKEVFKAFDSGGEWNKNFEHLTKKELLEKIFDIMSMGSSLALLDQVWKDLDAIKVMPISAIKHLSVRFE